MQKRENLFPDIFNCDVAIIGLGYVGLPLAVEIAKVKKCLSTSKNINRKVIGFDINKKRIEQLKKGIDITKSVDEHALINNSNLFFTANSLNIKEADIFIVTVPTPIDKNNHPDLSALKKASISVGNLIKLRERNTNPIVVYESTVYPGATEEVCIPLIEEYSGLKTNSNVESIKTFFYGYSPERVNPGDFKMGISDIVKLTSGNTDESSYLIDNFYKSFIKAGTYNVSSIKVAEAAKVIENTQRDINIALVNELSLIFEHMKIDTNDVLDAASTKWNFLPFRPGLVGGHCIGIDPYYLTFKAAEYGYHANLVLSGRSTNEKMAQHIADKLIINLSKQSNNLSKSKVLIMGCTFKENCSDIRNSKVFDLLRRLEEFNINVDICDPIAIGEEVKNCYNLQIKSDIRFEDYEAIIIAVAHDEYKDIDSYFWENLLNRGIIIFDIKGILTRNEKILRL
tara:strand:+ start:2326 stop:3690 length:1365 start_codon:yes stop_codon:yes gene_type:complete